MQQHGKSSAGGFFLRIDAAQEKPSAFVERFHALVHSNIQT
jgi:hypothetical protein